MTIQEAIKNAKSDGGFKHMKRSKWPEEQFAVIYKNNTLYLANSLISEYIIPYDINYDDLMAEDWEIKL
jgi:hypothetical protein